MEGGWSGYVMVSKATTREALAGPSGPVGVSGPFHPGPRDYLSDRPDPHPPMMLNQFLSLSVPADGPDGAV